MNIIPTINVETKVEAEKALKALQGLPITWVQFDIGDESFSSKKTWDDPEESMRLLREYLPGVSSEVHIMKRSVIEAAHLWIEAGVKKIIIHCETLNKEKEQLIRSFAETRGVRVMLALLPETPLDVLREYPEINEFQILSVHPGSSGQKFLYEVGEKIKKVKALFPSAYIEVDGGINRDTASFVAKTHVDAVAVGAYLAKSKNIQKDFSLLRELI